MGGNQGRYNRKGSREERVFLDEQLCRAQLEGRRENLALGKNGDEEGRGEDWWG